MNNRAFINKLEHDRIVQAIHDAEKKTSAEIRVFVSSKNVPHPVSAAEHQFNKLRMQQTKHRNAILLFIAPVSQTFAVIGDVGIHQHCKEEFWQQVVEEMTPHFKSSNFTLGLIHGVQRAGSLLAEHFPRQSDDGNELPNDLAHD